MEVFDREDVLHVRDVGPAFKLFLAPVPLVDHGPLRAAGQNQVGFVGDHQVFNVCVPVPVVEGLMGVEAIAIPFVDSGGTGLCWIKWT